VAMELGFAPGAVFRAPHIGRPGVLSRFARKGDVYDSE
jgi:hypothetical protein